MAFFGVGIWADFVSDPLDNSVQDVSLNYDTHPHYGVATLESRSTTPAGVFVEWVKGREVPSFAE